MRAINKSHGLKEYRFSLEEGKHYAKLYEKLQRMPRVYTGMNLFIMLWTQCPEHDNLFFKRSYCDIMSA